MAEMVKLFVNGSPVEVEAGKNLIDAIGAVGIEIPHLCYHPALGADGNCRLCLVGIEDGRPPLVPACKTPAQEGMRVQLDTEMITKIQRDILEFQLINHPLDCPVCDQAGECSLQDYYMTYGLVDSRMDVPQVTKGKKMDFGAGVVHDQERCVLCGRCVRFTREITKTGELGIVNRTDYARVVTFPGRPLDNRYALNVVDLCPVGAMTSDDFRFKQRVWFMSKDEGICHGCSKGCNIYIDHNRPKYEDDLIYRFRPRLNEQVNGYFMCDEGRMSYKEENVDRLREAEVNGTATSLDEALQAATKEIEKAEKVVFLLSPNCSLEQMAAVQGLAAKVGATLSGYSDGYIKAGDGDDYLIQDDKSANRAGFTLLNIDASKASFEEALAGANLLVTCNNNLFLGDGENEFGKKLDSIKVISVGTHVNELSQKSVVAIPVASYSETSGSIVNCDNILQTYCKAVVKNEESIDMIEAVKQLGGPMNDIDEARAALKKNGAALADVEFDQIPAEGFKLNNSEV